MSNISTFAKNDYISSAAVVKKIMQCSKMNVQYHTIGGRANTVHFESHLNKLLHY